MEVAGFEVAGFKGAEEGTLVAGFAENGRKVETLDGIELAIGEGRVVRGARVLEVVVLAGLGRANVD